MVRVRSAHGGRVRGGPLPRLPALVHRELDGVGAARVYAQAVTRNTGQRVVVVQAIADCRKDDAAFSISSHVELP